MHAATKFTSSLHCMLLPRALPSSLQSVPIVVADADDPESLSQMAGGTDVIISTAGPFAKYGTKVVEAALQQGSHYCDITGGCLGPGPSQTWCDSDTMEV